MTIGFTNIQVSSDFLKMVLMNEDENLIRIGSRKNERNEDSK